MIRKWRGTVILAFLLAVFAAGIASMACGLVSLKVETPHLDQIERPDDRKAISRYVECVDSRFPEPRHRYRTTTKDSVARELLADRLDLGGMEATYRNLGCGELLEVE